MSAALKMIHVACKQLGLDAEHRHDLQLLVTGKASLSDMTDAEHQAVLEALKKRGFKPGFKGAAKGRRAPAPRADLRYVHVLWTLLGDAGALKKPGRDGLADMTRKALSGPVKTSLIDMMDALGKGYSVSELLWEREGNGLRLAGVERVEPAWFEFDRGNGAHIYLRDNAGPQPLRADSFVVHIAKAKSGLAIRGGLARLAAWAYLFKNYTLKDWAIFMEAYGHPLRLGKYDSSASAEDRRTLLRAVRQIAVLLSAWMMRRALWPPA